MPVWQWEVWWKCVQYVFVLFVCLFFWGGGGVSSARTPPPPKKKKNNPTTLAECLWTELVTPTPTTALSTTRAEAPLVRLHKCRLSTRNKHDVLYKFSLLLSLYIIAVSRIGHIVCTLHWHGKTKNYSSRRHMKGDKYVEPNVADAWTSVRRVRSDLGCLDYWHVLFSLATITRWD